LKIGHNICLTIGIDFQQSKAFARDANMKPIITLAASLSLTLCAATAEAASVTRTITFDGTNPNTSQAFAHGDIIAQGIAAPGAVIDTYNSGEVRMRVNNVGADHSNSVDDLAVIFNSNATNTEDNDLEFGVTSANGAGWNTGNLSNPQTQLGNLVIIQEVHGDGISGASTCDDAVGGTCSSPDDEGSQPAGSLYFDFVNLDVSEIGFDLVDVEASGENGYFATLYAGGDQFQISFSDFLAGGAWAQTDAVVFGNNSANRTDFGGLAYRQCL
jgi:hypothetical protein